MYYAAIGLFAVSAVIGLTLLVSQWKGQPQTVPVSRAVLHGAFGATGLVVYIVAALKTGVTALSGTSLGLFVAAALGGFVLFGFHLKGRSLPKALMVIHALAAVSAFLMLLAVAFGRSGSMPTTY